MVVYEIVGGLILIGLIVAGVFFVREHTEIK